MNKDIPLNLSSRPSCLLSGFPAFFSCFTCLVFFTIIFVHRKQLHGKKHAWCCWLWIKEKSEKSRWEKQTRQWSKGNKTQEETTDRETKKRVERVMLPFLTNSWQIISQRDSGYSFFLNLPLPVPSVLSPTVFFIIVLSVFFCFCHRESFLFCLPSLVFFSSPSTSCIFLFCMQLLPVKRKWWWKEKGKQSVRAKERGSVDNKQREEDDTKFKEICINGQQKVSSKWRC